ncbi:MAG: hypothetical protein ABFD92_05720 [Planctomycetaceae bacterium]|nr:hypothetical protein [Planctomycetaceae bacterium]
MNKTLLLAVLAAVALALGVAATAQTSLPPSEGQTSFNPTRIQWLAMVLNAKSRPPASTTPGFLLYFHPDSKANTVLIHVLYSSTADRSRMQTAVNNARNAANGEIHGFAWQGWAKVKENYVQAK